MKKFNEVQTGKRNEYRRKVKEGKMSGLKGEDGGEEGDGEGEDEEGRATKRVRREEGDDAMMDEGDEGRERRESGTGDPSAQLQTGYKEYEAEDPDDDDFNADRQGGEEGENDESNVEHRPRDSRDGEEEEEEEDEEEDDEDEYPDEGRRLSSVEREENGSLGGPGDDAVTPGSSADEALSEDEGSD